MRKLAARGTHYVIQANILWLVDHSGGGSFLLCPEIRQSVKASRSGQGELNDLEAAVNGCLHRLGASLGGGCAEHCTGAVLPELITSVSGFVVLLLSALLNVQISLPISDFHEASIAC
jgi:hypothetical protein